MQRNDLTSEELRFKRLLQSLDRGPAAPDADFLRRLQETSTAAFVAAQTNRPRTRRAIVPPPVDPAIGRRRLRALRTAIFASVAALLVVGMLPTALFPSRGIELQVALNNLAQADFAEIEIQNGAGSNTLLFARSEDSAPRWRVDYASGNAEVSDGAATYFINRGNKSIHPSPLEEASPAPTFVEDKLLASLNLSDRAVKSTLMQQRPETAIDRNGQRLYEYNFQIADQRNNGETLTVNATVNADTKTLVAMNSEVRDAAGHSRFRANADVKSLNAVIPSDRFQLDLQAEATEQIAIVEDVQGLAVLNDLAQPPNSEPIGSAEIEAFTVQRAMNGAASQFVAPATEPVAEGAVTLQMPIAQSAAAPMMRARSLKKSESQAGGIVSPADKTATAEMATAKAIDPGPSAEMAISAAGIAGAATAEAVSPGQSAEETVAGGIPARPKRMMKGKAPAASAEVADEVLAAAQQGGDLRRNSKQPQQGSLALPSSAPMPAPAIARSMAATGSSPKLAPDRMNVSPAEPSMKQRTAMGRNPAELRKVPQNDGARAMMGGPMKPQGFSGAPQNLGMEASRFNAGSMLSDQARTQGAPMDPMRFNNAPGIPQNGLLNRAGDLNRSGELNRTGEFNLVRRQVAAQIELHPGGVLRTEDDSENVVWVRLANDTDLVLGPGTEVLLLKPTEVRLQVGELMLNVPAGDQVDLLGPDLAPSIEAAGDVLTVRRNSQFGNLNGTRLQVTGRGVYRIRNSQLQRVDQEPAWLVNYTAKQSGPIQNSRSMNRHSPASRNAGEPADVKDLNTGRPEPK